MLCEKDSEDDDDSGCSSSSSNDVDLRETTLHAAIFLFLVMPVIFVLIAFLFGLVASYVEHYSLLQSFGFMAAGATGGAIQIPGHNYSPQNFVTRATAFLAGSCGVGCYVFMISALNSLAPSYMPPDRADSVRQGQLCHFVWRMVSLALGLVALLLLLAFFFGAVLLQVESWEYGKAWKTMASVELGGGLPVPLGTPTTALGATCVVVVGCWAIGLVAMMVSATASYSAGIIEKYDAYLGNGSSPIFGLLKFGTTVLVLIPAALFIAMALVALPMSWMTDLDFMQAFWLSLPCVSGGDATVYPPITDHNMLRDVILIVSSTIGFLVLSVGLTLASDMLGPVVDAIGFGKKQRRGVKRAVAALLLSIFVYIPFSCCIFSVPIGGLLAYVEGWDFWWGFWWSVAAQLGGGLNLSPGSVVNTTGGRMLGVLTAAWSLGVASFGLGLTGAPVMDPLIKAIWQAEDEEIYKLTSQRGMRAIAP